MERISVCEVESSVLPERMQRGFPPPSLMSWLLSSPRRRASFRISPQYHGDSQWVWSKRKPKSLATTALMRSSSMPE